MTKPTFIVSTFYKFVPLQDIHKLRGELLDFCLANNIKGTILLAHEGINSTLSGTRDAIDNVTGFIRGYDCFADMETKESVYTEMPFYRMKVKIKKEIVTMGKPEIDPNLKNGHKLKAEEWNQLIMDPEVLVIDTRNQFEVELGTFENAISPETGSFSEFPEYVDSQLTLHKNRKIAMFCTGGIRCEKATSYLLEQGFENVFHLDGGILKYLEEVPEEENLWHGECFVFDNRVAVDKNLKKGNYSMCYNCRTPVSEQDTKSDKYEEGVSCPRCFDTLEKERQKNLRQRQFQVKLAAKRGIQHIGNVVERTK